MTIQLENNVKIFSKFLFLLSGFLLSVEMTKVEKSKNFQKGRLRIKSAMTIFF